jgi:hypothetical protein
LNGTTDENLAAQLCVPTDFFRNDNIQFTNQCEVLNNCTVPLGVDNVLSGAAVAGGAAIGAAFAFGGTGTLAISILLIKRFRNVPGAEANVIGDAANTATVTSGAFEGTGGATDNVLFDATA